MDLGVNRPKVMTRFGPNRPAADMEEMENLISW